MAKCKLFTAVIYKLFVPGKQHLTVPHSISRIKVLFLRVSFIVQAAGTSVCNTLIPFVTDDVAK
jgi:hypothetical protein